MKKNAETVYNGLVQVPDIRLDYKGFTIQPKLDFGGVPYQTVNLYKKGYVVTKNGTHALPGAMWAVSVIEAKVLIDIYLKVAGDSVAFWEGVCEFKGLNEYAEV